jgi:WD40 repeat protein
MLQKLSTQSVAASSSSAAPRGPDVSLSLDSALNLGGNVTASSARALEVTVSLESVMSRIKHAQPFKGSPRRRSIDGSLSRGVCLADRTSSISGMSVRASYSLPKMQNFKSEKQGTRDTIVRAHQLIGTFYKRFLHLNSMNLPATIALEHHYIEQQYSRQLGNSETFFINEYIQTWFDQPKQPVLLVLGGAGWGKSVLTHAWEQQLWSTLPDVFWVAIDNDDLEDGLSQVRFPPGACAVVRQSQQWFIVFQGTESLSVHAIDAMPAFKFVGLLQACDKRPSDVKQLERIVQGIQCYWLLCYEQMIPIRISLTEFNEHTAPTCVQDYFQAAQKFGLTLEDIDALKLHVHFLFLLDGYNRIKSSQNYFHTNLYYSNDLDQWSAKVLITCRTAYFEQLISKNCCFNTINKGMVNKVYLRQFTSVDIQTYLDYSFATLTPACRVSLQESTTQYPHLLDLLATPLLLYMYVSTYELNQIPPTDRWEIYQRYTAYLFRRRGELDLAKNRSARRNIKASTVETAYTRLTSEFALLLLRYDIDMFYQPHSLSSRLPRQLVALANFFPKDAIKKEFSYAAPFCSTALGYYGFAHESFKDFFVAKQWFVGLVNVVSEAGSDSDEAAVIKDWSIKSLPNRTEILDFLTAAITREPVATQLRLKACLWRWVQHSTAETADVAAKAATLLVRLGESFSQRTLAGVHLQGADLSKGLFDATNFQGANLAEVTFAGAWLRHANFQDANLSNTDWGHWSTFLLQGKVQACSYSSDGMLQIATVEGNRIHLWDGARRELLGTLRRHHQDVLCLVYSADGRWLASGGEDGLLCCWNTVDLSLKSTFQSNAGWILSVAFRPDGRHLASGCEDEAIHIWDVEAACLVKVLSGHTESITSLIYRGDGLQLASGCDDGSIFLWSVPRYQKEWVLSGHAGSVTCLVYTAKGKQLASGSEAGRVFIWNILRVQLVSRLRLGSSILKSLVYHPHDKQLACGSDDGKVYLWDLRAHRLASTLSRHSGDVFLAYSPDGECLASGGADHTMRFWNIEKMQMRSAKGGHAGLVTCLSSPAAGRCLVSGSADSTVRFWNLETQQLIRFFSSDHDGVTSLSYRSDGQQLVSGHLDGKICIYDGALTLLSTLSPSRKAVACVAYRPDGAQFAVGVASSIVLYDTTFDCVARLEVRKEQINSVAYRADGQQLASGGSDRVVRLWDVASKTVTAAMYEHLDSVTEVQYHPQGSQLASAGREGWVCLWDVAKQSLIATLDGHNGVVQALAYHDDGRQLVSGGEDHTVRLWDLAAHTCLGVLELPFEVNALKSYQHQLVVACGKAILVWNTLQAADVDEWNLSWRICADPMLNSIGVVLSQARLSVLHRRLLTQGLANTETPSSRTQNIGLKSIGGKLLGLFYHSNRSHEPVSLFRNNLLRLESDYCQDPSSLNISAMAPLQSILAEHPNLFKDGKHGKLYQRYLTLLNGVAQASSSSSYAYSSQ